jgi:hypothetical protein
MLQFTAAFFHWKNRATSGEYRFNFAGEGRTNRRARFIKQCRGKGSSANSCAQGIQNETTVVGENNKRNGFLQSQMQVTVFTVIGGRILSYSQLFSSELIPEDES